ncbi:MAG: flagellar hook capping FlgD N-terminal domain-containing protein [Syntrophorhabdaceae bacterium]|nr:flagellar hook capping FlgD N-terminal domain-containing protein [Syntrophorhabdaceae bacterium]
MAITSVTNTVDTTGTSSTTSSAATTELLDTNAFMNMLVTQLKYQDPLDPMETNEFMSQLAQLTQVERLQNIYDSLADLETTIETGNLLDMIGKKISVDGNTLSQGDEITAAPSADYDKVVFSITNINDGSVEEVTRNNGESLTYTNESADTVEVTASAFKNGSAVECATAAYRIVTGVKSTDTSVVLVAGNGDQYTASSVTTIKN